MNNMYLDILAAVFTAVSVGLLLRSAKIKLDFRRHPEELNAIAAKKTTLTVWSTTFLTFSLVCQAVAKLPGLIA